MRLGCFSAELQGEELGGPVPEARVQLHDPGVIEAPKAMLLADSGCPGLAKCSHISEKELHVGSSPQVLIGKCHPKMERHL